MTVQEFARTVKLMFRERGGEAFFTEKALLLALFEKNGFPSDARLTQPDRPLSPEEEKRLLADCTRLLSGYPLQYYLGSEFFDGREYLCREGVLIPRADTEVLVRLAAETVPENGAVWDLCCGTGCVGIALLLRRPDLSVLAFDLAPEAVELAAENARRLAPEAPFAVEKADVLSDGFRERFLREKPDLVLSNPPYVTAEEMTRLPANVRREPALALEGGRDGQRFYRRFVSLAAESGVPFLAEVGKGQAEAVFSLAEKAGLACSSFPDGAGAERVVSVRKKVAENC